MLIDTHCHINLLVHDSFEVPLSETDLEKAEAILFDAASHEVNTILNVGTSLIESKNCIALAQRYPSIFCSIGIHPNDLTDSWKQELKELDRFLEQKNDLKIVGIGECGLDAHYPEPNLARQKEAFTMQIEMALKHDLPLVIHTRDVGDETLKCLEPYKKESLRGTIHCFSEDLAFAQEAIAYGFVLGFGGTVTYPKNEQLRHVAQRVGLNHIILETDAPFLPPQTLRGKKNHPKNIQIIAQYLAQLLSTSYEEVARITTSNASRIFFRHTL